MKNPKPALAAALLLGLALPFLTAAFEDERTARAVWTLPQAEDHYVYQGTLLNRVVALNARLNFSPAVREASREESTPDEALRDALTRLFPADMLPASARAETFRLIPVDYPAEYRYVETTLTKDNLSLTIISDAETRLPLRIELRCPPGLLDAHPEIGDLWSLLHNYAALLGLGEITDGASQRSERLHTQTVGIRGASLSLSAALMPSEGALVLKLAGA